MTFSLNMQKKLGLRKALPDILGRQSIMLTIRLILIAEDIASVMIGEDEQFNSHDVVSLFTMQLLKNTLT